MHLREDEEEEDGDDDSLPDDAVAAAEGLAVVEAVAGTVFEAGLIDAVAVEVMATGGSGILQQPVMSPPVTELPAFTAAGGSGFNPSFGDINVSGATPTVIDPDKSKVPPNTSGALVVGAFITALGDISSKLRGTAPAGRILQLPGPPVIKAAIAAGIVVVASTANIESVFTALMGEREGRFESDRPEERAVDEAFESGGQLSVSQVQRPARGFLVDLSQRFIPPPSETGGGDVARPP